MYNRKYLPSQYTAVSSSCFCPSNLQFTPVPVTVSCCFYFPEMARHYNALLVTMMHTVRISPQVSSTLLLYFHIATTWKPSCQSLWVPNSLPMIPVVATSTNKSYPCLQTPVPLGSWSERCCYIMIFRMMKVSNKKAYKFLAWRK